MWFVNKLPYVLHVGRRIDQRLGDVNKCIIEEFRQPEFHFGSDLEDGKLELQKLHDQEVHSLGPNQLNRCRDDFECEIQDDLLGRL